MPPSRSADRRSANVSMLFEARAIQTWPFGVPMGWLRAGKAPCTGGLWPRIIDC